MTNDDHRPATALARIALTGFLVAVWMVAGVVVAVQGRRQAAR
ncbi:MAG: hypothetical protein QM658_08105 [Gordonia sp. (in: high G+C Gram-positive bacteria)]